MEHQGTVKGFDFKLTPLFSFEHIEEIGRKTQILSRFYWSLTLPQSGKSRNNGRHLCHKLDALLIGRFKRCFLSMDIINAQKTDR